MPLRHRTHRPNSVSITTLLVGIATLAMSGCNSPTDTPAGSAGGHENSPLGKGGTDGKGGSESRGASSQANAVGGAAKGGSSATSSANEFGGTTPTSSLSPVASGGKTSASGGAASSLTPGGGRVGAGGKQANGGAQENGGGPTVGGAIESGGATPTTVVVGVSGRAGGGRPTGVAGAATGGNTGVGGGAEAGSSSEPPSGSCPSTVIKSGDTTQNIKVGSLSRSYYLHIPTGYTGTKPLPVVVDFHPLGGTGQQQASSNSWKSKADSVGFITVYPNSYNSNNSWNAGMCCQDAQQNKIDDVAFLREIVKHLTSIACVDNKRIYATGCSNGGGMTYKAACDAADLLAAAAPVDFRCVYGGSTSAPSCEGCKPARPITIAHFDNTGDTSLVPYKGGMTSFAADCPAGGSCTGMGFPSCDANFEAWQKIDGCSGAAAALTGHADCKTVSTCEGGSQVTNCVKQGGSHCGNYSSLGIVDIAWEIFQQQSLP